VKDASFKQEDKNTNSAISRELSHRQPKNIPPHTTLPIRGKKAPSPTRTKAQVTCNMSLHKPWIHLTTKSRNPKEEGIRL